MNYCPNCGKKLVPEHKYCGECGVSVASHVSIPPPLSPSPKIQVREFPKLQTKLSSIQIMGLSGVILTVISYFIFPWIDLGDFDHTAYSAFELSSKDLGVFNLIPIGALVIGSLLLSPNRVEARIMRAAALVSGILPFFIYFVGYGWRQADYALIGLPIGLAGITIAIWSVFGLSQSETDNPLPVRLFDKLAQAIQSRESSYRWIQFGLMIFPIISMATLFSEQRADVSLAIDYALRLFFVSIIFFMVRAIRQKRIAAFMILGLYATATILRHLMSSVTMYFFHLRNSDVIGKGPELSFIFFTLFIFGITVYLEQQWTTLKSKFLSLMSGILLVDLVLSTLDWITAHPFHASKLNYGWLYVAAELDQHIALFCILLLTTYVSVYTRVKLNESRPA